jgi:hypothetical protein
MQEERPDPVRVRVTPWGVRPEQTDGTDRPDWTTPLFRYIAKVSRQVLRVFKHCFLKPASPALYERELRPLLMAYL